MKMKTVNQYKKLAQLFYKYGTSNLVKNAGLSDSLEDEDYKEDPGDVPPEELLDDLVDMGPAFIKLGQLLSTRPDLLPRRYTEALSELQDNVPPFDYAEVERIFQEEIGVRISKAFDSFDEKPLASASLGQVHNAVMRDGTQVVVKIQRPGIRQQILDELEVLESVASFLDKNTAAGKRISAQELMEYFKRTLLRELDYTKEAMHMRILKENLKRFEKLVVPAPIDDLSSRHVLTMKYVKGENISGISPLRKMELDGSALVEELFKAYLQQVVIDGFMHADPHPGNIHLTDDDRIALLDLGMVAYFGQELREDFLKLLLYLGEANGDKLAKLLKEMSRELDEVNPGNFQKEISLLVQENQYITMGNLQTGKLVFELIRVAGDNGYVLPVGMSLLAKALFNLDQVGAVIAPEFDPQKAIRKNVTEIMRKYVSQNLLSYNFFTSAVESKEFLEMLPERMNKLFGHLAENEWEVKVKAIDEKQFTRGIQKVANRITMGLIIAALLISASMLMQIPSGFMMFGYPGLAITAFIIAVAGAVMIAFQVWFRDE